MRIGIVADGQAETLALQDLVRRIATRAQCVLSPVYADMQPKDTAAQIARAALSRVRLLLERGANHIVVLLDREDNRDCPPDLALSIGAAFRNQGYLVNVIVKNCCFENWLIADPYAFQAMPGRFEVTESFIRAVRPNKADLVSDPGRLINRITKGVEYHKRRDARALAQRLDVDEAGRNSRSFRRFLRHLGHPDYSIQSKRPAR